MSAKNRYGKFRKKDYVRLLEYTVWRLCREFGYVKEPQIFETELLEKNATMLFAHYGKHFAVFYDYKKFRKFFGRLGYNYQKIILVGIVAHEMRHYYQHRQMQAKISREKAEIIERWKKDEDGEFKDLPLHLQPLELDAQLFSITFLDKTFGVVSSYSIFDNEHVTALENLYREYYGEIDEELFSVLRSYAE
ncbi:MAG: hypothetical protein IKA72_03685 [Clostridia bacterium]|nr:hypothetical protein [Clostridia bacterium]